MDCCKGFTAWYQVKASYSILYSDSFVAGIYFSLMLPSLNAVNTTNPYFCLYFNSRMKVFSGDLVVIAVNESYTLYNDLERLQNLSD